VCVNQKRYSHTCHQPLLRPQCEWETSFMPIQERQNYTSVYLTLYIFREQTRRQRILHQMIVSILPPDFKLILICSWMKFWFVMVVSINLNCSTLWKQLLSIFTLWFCPACCWRHMDLYFIFSAFSSQHLSLLVTNKASLLFFIMCMVSPNIQGVQLKSGQYFNMNNLFTKNYNMLYYTTNLYLQ